MTIGYPPTKRVDHVDRLHGVEVPDPYRWLEELDAPEVREWVRAQNALTERVLSGYLHRGAVGARLAELLAYERWNAPVRRGGRTFALWNDGKRAQAVLCRLGGEDEDPAVLVDPNPWSDDGTVAITAFVPSADGARVAYAIARAGSDWTEWRIVDVETAAELDDRIERIRFSSPAWSGDGAGLFHAAFDADDLPRVRYHRLGTKQSEDVLVFDRRDRPAWRFQPVVTEDGRRLVLYVFDQTGGPNGIVCLGPGGDDPVLLPDAFRARFAFCGNDGSIFWFVTDLDAPRRRLVSIDVDAPEHGWREIVAESVDTLEWVLPKGDRLLAGYLTDAQTVVRRFTVDGAPDGVVALPGVGWAGGFVGERSDPESYFLFMSFTQPPAVYRYDVDANVSTLSKSPALAFEPGAFGTSLQFIESKDGTRVPVFLTHARDLERDGQRPVLLWGYGGFGIPIVPWYWPLAIAWMERGGIFATAGIRGGGEYGEAWHRDGSGAHKQNSFDDLVAVAEWLCAEGYTNPRRLALSGASNGGLLVGACLTQHPDLFAAAHIDMGLLDMLHIDRVQVGLAMEAEFGSLDDAEDARRLRSYSPLHNLRPGTRYPAVLLTTGDHDELVLPSNSYKFVAAMQSAQGADRPVLLRVEFDTGHGVGKPAEKTHAEQSDILTFLLAAVGEG